VHLVYPSLINGSAECYKGPVATDAKVVTVIKTTAKADTIATTTVTVSFDPSTLCGGLVIQEGITCPFAATDKNHLKCGWYGLQLPGSSMAVNASASIDGDALVLTAMSRTSGATSLVGDVLAQYLWADWPVATLYNRAGLPALPFSLQAS
jgi:hypothetical protein